MAESDRYLAPGHSLDELKAADGQTGCADILKHGVTGQGLNDYAAIFRALRGVGFAGWIPIEDYLKAMRRQHYLI